MLTKVFAVVLPVATWCLAGPSGAEGSVAPLHVEAMAAVERAEADLIAFRHDLHRFPELAGEEERTAGKVVAALSRLGYDVRNNVGGYGVVAILKGGRDGPLVAFRADMDAVAGEAVDPVPYASEINGAHHICGHDVHTAIGIGLAEGFASIRERLPGDVMLIFQPAEETGTGAEAMLADGIFESGAPSAILAVHTAPFDIGELAVLPDGMMAGRMLVRASLTGHGDLETAAAGLREAFLAEGDVATEEIFGFRTDPFVHVNLFPQSPVRDGEIVVQGFIMSAGVDRRADIKEQFRDAAKSVREPNVLITVTFEQALEGVNNDAELVARTSGGIEQRAGHLTVLEVPGVIPAFSEDFGSFQRSVPGVMYFLGVNNPDEGTVGFPHSPGYVADDASIKVGTEAMLAAMLEVMTGE